MRRRIAIINDTHHSTRDLRRIVVRACREVLAPRSVPHLRVKVADAKGARRLRGFFHRGNAISPPMVTLALPRRPVGASTVAAITMRCLYAIIDRKASSVAIEWANPLPLAYAPPTKARPTAFALTMKRLARARQLLAQWQAKAARAERAITKYEKRIQYYERRLPGVEARMILDTLGGRMETKGATK